MPKSVEFDPPKGFVLPEGKAVNEDFEIMAVIRQKPSGRLCLVEVDGVRMPGYREDEDDGKTYAQAAADDYDEMGK